MREQLERVLEAMYERELLESVKIVASSSEIVGG